MLQDLLQEDFLQRRPYNAATDLVDANVARGLGDKIAFVDSERSITFGSLQSRTYQFAASLKALGLRPEDRIALLLYDTVDFPVVFWGAVRAGIVVIPLNTLLTAEQWSKVDTTVDRGLEFLARLGHAIEMPDLAPGMDVKGAHLAGGALLRRLLGA